MTKKLTRNVLSAAMAVVMVIFAEVLGESEIIFPEIVALLIGMWLSERQPWVVSKPAIVITMSLSAAVGVCIVRYVHVHMLIQLAIAFAIIAVMMMLSRSTFAPMLSACLLPILIRTESVIYPISVFVMSSVLVLVRLCLERNGFVQRVEHTSLVLNYRVEVVKWLWLFVVYLLVAAAPVLTGNYYFIAPPLVVIFVSLADVKSPLRKTPVKVVLLAACAALIGTLSRWAIVELLSLPLTVAALASVVVLFVMLRFSGMYLPPLGALAYLPLILPAEGLCLYPIEVTVGAAVFTLFAKIFRPRK